MPSPETMKSRDGAPLEKRISLISLGLLCVGVIGYFLIPRGPLIFYVFAHIGALGLLGLIGSAVGVVAKKKGHGYPTALALGCLLPIASGLIAVAAVAMARDQVYCGGSVSLAVAVLVALAYLVTGKKKLPRSRHAG